MCADLVDSLAQFAVLASGTSSSAQIWSNCERRGLAPAALLKAMMLAIACGATPRLEHSFSIWHSLSQVYAATVGGAVASHQGKKWLLRSDPGYLGLVPAWPATRAMRHPKNCPVSWRRMPMACGPWRCQLVLLTCVSSFTSSQMDFFHTRQARRLILQCMTLIKSQTTAVQNSGWAVWWAHVGTCSYAISSFQATPPNACTRHSVIQAITLWSQEPRAISIPGSCKPGTLRNNPCYSDDVFPAWRECEPESLGHLRLAEDSKNGPLFL